MVAAHSPDDDVMSTQDWSVLDDKTPISFCVGVIAGMSNLNASWATVVVIGFEAAMVMLEETSVAAPFKKRISAKSVGNSAVDTLAGITGVAVGESIRRRQLQAQAMEAGSPALPEAPPLPAAPVPEQPVVDPAVVSGLAGSRFVNTQFPLVRTRPVLGLRHVPRR